MHVSFVLPCLNEEATLARCIQAIRGAFDVSPDLEYEIVVADNGSDDGSTSVAENNGARLVHVPQRGYGSALRHGIAAARGEHVVFADADCTYHLEDAYSLYETAVNSKADLAIASRFGKGIEPGAMPWLHRFVGTPILTMIVNLLFCGHVTDCNSGFRCVRKAAFEGWGTKASGMEFASEMIVRALKAKARIVEIPSGLRRSPKDRSPHLSTWRDGMRHLILILSERPRAFECVGLSLLLFASLLQMLVLFVGPAEFLGLHVFDVHSQAILAMVGLAGSQFYLFSCAMFLYGREKPGRLTKHLLGIGEAHLLLCMLCLGLVGSLVIVGVVATWASNDFVGLAAMPWLIGTLHFVCLPSLWLFGLLGLHILKSMQARDVPDGASV